MSKFVEVKTADLVGAALDWAVAKAEGFEPMLFPMGRNKYGVVACSGSASQGDMSVTPCAYSTDWSQGGPLIQSNKVDLEHIGSDWHGGIQDFWVANTEMEGGTALIAACRAIVASVLGDTVSVPKELLS